MSPTADSPIVFVLTTLAVDTDASAFARTLLDERLAACVSILPPMTSVYRWKGTVEEAMERQVLIKTTTARIDALEARFRTLHPYELPEFVIVQPAEVSHLYQAWLREQID